MTQHELIDAVHTRVSNRLVQTATLAEITKMITDQLVSEGVTALPDILAKLEPAAICYVRTYPNDLSDGPWDI